MPAFTVLYGYGEARNWRALEADAYAAVATQRYSHYGWTGFYLCPPDLAARAVAPDWVSWQVEDVLARRALPSGARRTTWAVRDGVPAVGQHG